MTMKHITIAAAALAVLCGAAACTSGNKNAENATLTEMLSGNLENATSFSDSLVAIEGAFIGGFFNSQLQNQDAAKPVNKAEFIRGLKDALKCDTADMSYVYGFNSGSQALQTYIHAAQNEGVSREAFAKALLQALSLDSVNSGELMAIRNQFDMMERQMGIRAEQRAKDAAKATKEGQENIMLGEAYVSGLDKKTEFVKTESGVYQHVITPGSGETLDPNKRVMASYTISRLDGTELSSTTQPRMLYVAAPSAGALRGVLQLMKPGETSEFYVPYQLAYGELGNKAAGVGPCESLLVRVAVEPDTK